MTVVSSDAKPMTGPGGPRKGQILSSCPLDESTALLARFEGHERTATHTTAAEPGAAAGRAVCIGEALSRDELRAVPEAHVLGAGLARIDARAATSRTGRGRSHAAGIWLGQGRDDNSLGGAAAGRRRWRCGLGEGCRDGGVVVVGIAAAVTAAAGSVEAAALLPLGEGDSRARADAASIEARAAARRAVRVRQAGPRDELAALAVADVLVTCGVGSEGEWSWDGEGKWEKDCTGRRVSGAHLLDRSCESALTGESSCCCCEANHCD